MKLYWNFVRMEKMRELLKEGRAEEALEIADTLDLNSIRSIHDINTVAEVYYSSGRLSRANEAYMIVYRHSKTRRVIMQLINIALERKSVKDAEHFANEYAKMSEGDFYNEIYRYSIDKLKEKDISVLIRDLEKLKHKEYIDSWAYELAKLYFKSGETSACIKECDNIAVWFGEGEYVDRAKALADYCRKLMEEEQEAKAAEAENTAEGDENSDAGEEYEVEVTLEELEAFEAEEQKRAEQKRKKRESYLEECIRNVEEAVVSEAEINEITEEYIEENDNSEDISASSENGEMPEESETKPDELIEFTNESEEVDDEELFEAWKEATADENQPAGDEPAAETEAVSDTEKEEAASDSEENRESDKNRKKYSSRWEEPVVTAKEIPLVPYREPGDEELDRIADDVAVATDSEEEMVYRMLQEEEKLLRDAVNMAVSEDVANRRQENLYGEAEAEATAETGKTAEPEETDESKGSEETEESKDTAEPEITEEAAGPEADESAATENTEATEALETSETADGTENTADEAAEEFSLEASLAEIVEQEMESEAAAEPAAETEETTQEAHAVTITSAPADYVKKSRESAAAAVLKGGYLDKFLEKKGTELDSYFGYYAFNEGVRGQLVRALEIMLNPQARSLNLIISGEKGSGAQEIAKGIIKLRNKDDQFKPMAIAELDSEQVNHMDIMAKAGKLQGNCLIIRDAGRLTNASADSVRKLSEKLVGKKAAIILIDTRSGINELLRSSKALNSCFSNRVHLPGLSDSELKKMAYTMIAGAELELSEGAETQLSARVQEMGRLNREGAYSELQRLVRRIIESVENRNAREYIAAQMENREAAAPQNIILAEDIK